jgi:hypothetical protein
MSKKPEPKQAKDKKASERRYRSLAEIRRDLFPELPQSVFETGMGPAHQEDPGAQTDDELLARG